MLQGLGLSSIIPDIETRRSTISIFWKSLGHSTIILDP